MIDERPIRRAIERVIAKHQVLWVLEQLQALPPGERVRYVLLTADLAAAWATFRALTETPRVEEPRKVRCVTLHINTTPMNGAPVELIAMIERMNPGVTVH
jgi:hypothetical protein